jgi:membrane-associated phospholipid phosphatase
MPAPVAAEPAAFVWNWPSDGVAIGVMAAWDVGASFLPLPEPTDSLEDPTWSVDAAALAVLRSRIDSGSGAMALADTGSNALVGALMVAPGVWWGVRSAGAAPLQRSEATVEGGIAWEAGLAAYTFADAVKRVAPRARPYAVACLTRESSVDACLDEFGSDEGSLPWLGRDPYASFPSAHTATAAALAFSIAHMHAATHPDGSRWLHAFLPYSLASAATIGTGVLRVEAGKHFPSDVITGGLLGLGMGILVPELHRVGSGSLVVDVGACGASPCLSASGPW